MCVFFRLCSVFDVMVCILLMIWNIVVMLSSDVVSDIVVVLVGLLRCRYRLMIVCGVMIIMRFDSDMKLMLSVSVMKFVCCVVMGEFVLI